MARNHFRIDGLAELREALHRFTPELVAEARQIGLAHALNAERLITNAYPRRTGKTLRDKMKVTAEDTQFTTSAVVANTSKLARIFEEGTQARHTALGADRGAMPAGRVFVPFYLRERRDWLSDLKDVITREGLQVSGDA